MSTWMIGCNDGAQTLSLYQWELDQLKCRGECSYEEAAEKIGPDFVPCYFETENVSFFEILLPKTSEKKIRQALPSLVDEQLASLPENTFYALPSDFKAGENCVVAVCSLDYLKDKIQKLQEAGLSIQSFSPDCFLLPSPTQTHHKFIQQDRVIVRTGAYQGFAMKQEHALLIMKELDGLPALSPGLYEKPPFNFLQGEFLIKPAKQPLQALQWFYLTLGLALVLHLLALVVMGFLLNKRLDLLKSESLSLYSEIFPGATKVSAAKSLIERELQSAGASPNDPLMHLIAVLGVALQLQPGAQLQSLDYQDARLNVSLTLPNMDAVDLLNQSLNDSRLPARDQQIFEQDQAVVLQFTLSQEPKSD